MYDVVTTTHTNLSHDLPCRLCGHARHTFLACSDTCDCVPAELADLAARAGTPVAPGPRAVIA